MKKLFVYCVLFFLIFFKPLSIWATSYTPQSTHYQIREYNFGAGGTASSSSNTYSLFGNAGTLEYGSESSNIFAVNSGLSFVNQASIPPAPTVTNPSNYYNKLQVVISNSGNSPTDTQFAIAISSDNFNTYKYVQSDQTINNTIVWQTYASWGGSSGLTVIGLNPSTTYSVKVAAKQGAFSQTGFGPVAQASTVNPSISFSLGVGSTYSGVNPPYAIGVGTINAGAITTAPSNVYVNLTTNANAGATVYLYDANSGLFSPSAGSYVLPSVSGNLTSISEGYGAIGLSTSGVPMEILSPYNGSPSTVVGQLQKTAQPIFDSTNTPVTNGQGSFTLEAKAKNTTPAANDFSDTITLIVAGSF